ncbi:MAG: glycosyltransferase family 4 protein [Planctomycetes bacterium]|nr:glycosyltransferase family 4 protein [Planctomycetota bacterium]
MRILHLYGDYRWTGPAEPVVTLCLALRRLGHTVHFACRATPRRVRQSIEREAIARGLKPVTAFHLNRYFNVLANLSDLRSIRRFCEREKIDLVHTHLSHDHLIGGLAARRVWPVEATPAGRAPFAGAFRALFPSARRSREDRGAERAGPRIVRTNHKGIPLKPGSGNRWLARSLTDGYSGFSRAALATDRLALGIPDERTAVLPLAIDLARFVPRFPPPGLRTTLGIPEGVPLGGIVARMQRHRRFDVLLHALARAMAQVPDLHFCVIGRGTHRRKVAIEPAREMGLAGRVHFAGYLKEGYLDTLAALDFKVFLVPGSDGTCRAVREVMAMGKPVIAARRGMLPEIVRDGLTGIVVEEGPEPLSQAIVALARDPARRAALGAAARESALRDYDVEAQARACLDWYERICSLPPAGPGPLWIGKRR